MNPLGFHPWSITLRTPEHIPLDPWTALLFAATAVAAGALTWRRPAYGIAALILLAPFGPQRYLGPTTITLLKAGVLGMLVTFVARRPSLGVVGTPVIALLLAVFAGAEVAIALSATQAEFHAPVVREALKTAEYAVLFVSAAIAYASDPDDRPYWRILETTTLLVCVSALAEYVVGAHSGIFLLNHALSMPRIAGALEGPNQLAGWLEIAIPVLFARNLLHRDGLLVAVLALAVVTDLLTFSRAGIVAMVVACAIVVVLMRTPRVVGMRFAIGTIAAIAVLATVALHSGVPPGYFSLDQVPQQADHLGNRAALWSAAITLWHQSPIVGIGAGNYEFEIGRAGFPGIRTHANSIYLQSLAEGGIVMLVATLSVFVTVIVMFARSGVRRPIVVGMLAATVALAAHQIFDDLFFFPKVGSMFWLTLGVAGAEIATQALFVRRRSVAPVVVST